MDALFQELLSVLNSISEGLVRLSQLQQKKKEVVMGDDLMALNEIINNEQAEALAFRGLEQKRAELLKKLNLHATGLQAMPGYFPDELRGQAEQAVKKIQGHYNEYRVASDAARKVLENGMAEIDHVLAAMGEPSPAGPGYAAQNVAPPSNMKTDFRA